MLKGVYTATTSAEGYFSHVVPDLPVWSGTVVQDFSLQPEVTLTGLVNDNTTYTPITGAQVLVNTGAFTYTDTGGIYTLILPPRVYTATASADGYMPLGFTGIEQISGTVIQDFSLHPVNCPIPQILDVTVNIIDPLTLSFSPTVSSTLPVD